MMYQPIDLARTRWCILRTSGAKTLPLARSLVAAGIEAWTPIKTVKRPKQGNCLRPDGTRPTFEVDAPVLATFVFARACHLFELAEMANAPFHPHPAFSVFRFAGEAPLVSDASVNGLRRAEKEAAEEIQAVRDAETRDEAERIRIAAIKSENARLKAERRAAHERRQALRAQRIDVAVGSTVTLLNEPSFTGRSGVVKSSDGRTAKIAFGGLLTIDVEAWQVLPTGVTARHPEMEPAA